MLRDRLLLSSLSSHGNLGTCVQRLLGSPASYALVVATPLALTTYATALQRGTVVQATAPLVVGETLLPALVGVTMLGDHARPGWAQPLQAVRAGPSHMHPDCTRAEPSSG